MVKSCPGAGKMGKLRSGLSLLALIIGLTAGLGLAQDTKKQEIPDAPSASRPPQPVPQAEPPAPAPTTPDQIPAQSPAEAAPEAPPVKKSPPPETGGGPATPPPLKITTVPEGGATQETETTGTQDLLYKFVTAVNQVMVPVAVKDDSGHLVSGLLYKDFSVYEDGVKQRMNFFTSDPFPLSAAVILDTGLQDVALQKVNQTFTSLEGAFSEFDEVSFYTYSSTVSRLVGFGAVGRDLTLALNGLKTQRGHNNGPPVLGGPLGPQGPLVNNNPIDTGVPTIYTPPKEAHVLNDAILRAAVDLGKRDRSRRKIIFVISDGREYGSDASYQEVLKVLLSQGILVYGIGVEGASIPVYNKISKLHLPRMGYSDILPKYANATGGWIYNEFSRDSIEAAYARVTGDARNQYTLGYSTRATPSSTYRQIEVRVSRGGLKVYAKDGYYPLPPAR